MKHVLLLCLFTSLGYSQPFPIDSVTHRITYQEVVSLDSSFSKEKLFARAHEWFAKTFKDSRSVIQMDDPSSGKLVGKASLQVFVTALWMKYEAGWVKFTVSIATKDSRYRYQITDFSHDGAGSKLQSVYELEKPEATGSDMTNGQWEEIKGQVHLDIKEMIRNLKTFMRIKEDEW